MLAAVFVTFSLSAFQIGALILMLFAAIALAFVLGLGEGRLREAAEPREKLAEDDGDGLGPRVRRRH